MKSVTGYRSKRVTLVTALLLGMTSVLLAPRVVGQPKPAAPGADLSQSPWGVSTPAISFRTAAGWMPDLEISGVRQARGFSDWTTLEPRKGTMDWTESDAWLKSATTNRMQVTGVLYGTPVWTREQPQVFPMRHLDAWNRYAELTVARYKDQVHDWQVWNWVGAGAKDAVNKPADYAKLVADAYDTVKRVDPSARIGLSASDFNVDYLHQTMVAQNKLLKANHFDFVSIEPYGALQSCFMPDGEIPFLWMSNILREAINDAAPQKIDADIVIGKLGNPLNLHQADDYKALRIDVLQVSKAYIMAMAQGIKRIHWIQTQDLGNNRKGTGLSDSKSASGILQYMTGVLGETPEYLGWVSIGRTSCAYGFIFQGKKGPILVAWAPIGLKVETVAFTKRVLVYDVDKTRMQYLEPKKVFELRWEPCYFGDLPPDLVEQAKLNRSKPFPWGGDYSALKSVSIQFTADGAVSKGLFPARPTTRLGAPITPAVGRGGAIYALFLHPTFASFRTREYYVRVKIRRTNPGNIRIALDYAVANSQVMGTPMKTADAIFTAPVKNDTYSVVWRLSDACFSKPWGFDIGIRPIQSEFFELLQVDVSIEPFRD